MNQLDSKKFGNAKSGSVQYSSANQGTCETKSDVIGSLSAI